MGCGNVFEDLGLPEPERLLRKADLASEILSYLEREHASSADAATAAGLSCEKLVKLRRGDLHQVRVEELENALVRIRAVESDDHRAERAAPFGLR